MEKKPEWLKVKFNTETVSQVSSLMVKHKLNTVCKEANCPNLGECYNNGTATFMILGSNCTRHCRFCNVSNEAVDAVDPEEPSRLAKAVKDLGLQHVVITSVTRDDLEDGGARHFAKTIQAVRQINPNTTIEVLIPDLLGIKENLDIIIQANPDVIGHNMETVEPLYDAVRPEADYNRSIEVLEYVKKKAPHIYSKTGIMVGLGEEDEQVYKLMDDCLEVACDIFTIGQYLRPSPQHIQLKKYVHPDKFEEYKRLGIEKGFKHIFSAPLVRSSYNAGEIFRLEGSLSNDIH